MISSAEKFKVSERQCIATGQVLSKSKLIRFVLGPDSVIYPDPENKLPGRGIWVKADRSAILQAEKGQLFSSAAKQSAECLENLAELVENLMVGRIINLIGLSRKSGQCICGYEKVKDWLKTKGSVLLPRTAWLDQYQDQTDNDYWTGYYNMRGSEPRIMYNPYANSGVSTVNLGAGGKISGPITITGI